jgi:hypothetical protein
MADALVLAAVGGAALSLGHASGVLTLAFSLGVLAALGLFKTYTFVRRESLAAHQARLAVAILAGLGGATLALLPAAAPADLARGAGTWAPAAFLALQAAHLLWWSNVRRWRANGRLTPNIVVVGGYTLLAGGTPYSGLNMLFNEVVTVPLVEEVVWRGVVFTALLAALLLFWPIRRLAYRRWSIRTPIDWPLIFMLLWLKNRFVKLQI